MSTSAAVNCDTIKKTGSDSKCERDDSSNDSDCYEDTTAEINIKKRKLWPNKSKSSKKRRRSPSTGRDEGSVIVSAEKSASMKQINYAQDTYCWICHKPENIFPCYFCPRVYHQDCLLSFFAQNQFDKDECVCPECITIMMSECTVNIDSRWKSITQSELNEMLSFVLLRLYNINGSSQFQTAVDNQTIRDYYVIIKHPVHLNKLKSNISQNLYQSVQAFFCDFKWILHNCTIYNGVASILTSYARNLEKLCVKELNLLKSCPECFRERMPFMIKVLNEQNKAPLDKSWNFSYDEKSVNDMWMTKLCKLIHPLVWVRLHSYPIWPGKLIALDEESALVLFFGDYDLNIVPIGSICVHTQSNHKRLISNIANFTSRRPATSAMVTTSFTKEYQLALEELNIHLDRIKRKFEHFNIPNKKIEFNIQKGVEFYERLRLKHGSDHDVIVCSSIDDGQSREDCASEVTSCDKTEVRFEVEKLEKMDSTSTTSVTSAQPNMNLKSYREPTSGPQFMQCFEHGVQNLLNKFKKECLSYIKSPGRDGYIDEWPSFKYPMDNAFQNVHQQTDIVPVKNVGIQFSSKEFEKEEEVDKYVKYLEQCLSAAEIELRRQEILSSIRHEEYTLEFSKQQKEIRQLYDNELRDVIKIIHEKVEDKFARTSRIFKTNEWCAFCGKLARFYCCWNTCYCNQDCQTKHWEIHKVACTQIHRAQTAVVTRSPVTNPTVVYTSASINGMQSLVARNGEVGDSGLMEYRQNVHMTKRLPLRR